MFFFLNVPIECLCNNMYNIREISVQGRTQTGKDAKCVGMIFTYAILMHLFFMQQSSTFLLSLERTHTVCFV